MDILSFDSFKFLPKKLNLPSRLRVSKASSLSPLAKSKAGRFPLSAMRRADAWNHTDIALTAARIFPLRAARRLEFGEPFGISERPR
jgi:hypothetical protein